LHSGGVLDPQGGEHPVGELVGGPLGDACLTDGAVDVVPQGTALLGGGVGEVARVDVAVRGRGGGDGGADARGTGFLFVVEVADLDDEVAAEGGLFDADSLPAELVEEFAGLAGGQVVGHWSSP